MFKKRVLPSPKSLGHAPTAALCEARNGRLVVGRAVALRRHAVRDTSHRGILARDWSDPADLETVVETLREWHGTLFITIVIYATVGFVHPLARARQQLLSRLFVVETAGIVRERRVLESAPTSVYGVPRRDLNRSRSDYRQALAQEGLPRADQPPSNDKNKRPRHLRSRKCRVYIARHYIQFEPLCDIAALSEHHSSKTGKV